MTADDRDAGADAGAGTESRTAAVAAVRERLLETLATWVRRGTRVALLDFPQHSNVGDSAIWSGEMAWLAKVGAVVVHRSTSRTFDAAAVRRRLGRDGVVLVHGGGNLGDLYVRHHALRMRVLAELSDRRVVQLPQTANFSTPAALEAFGAAAARVPGLRVLVRDEESLALLRPHLPVEPVLAPDMAFALPPLERPAAPTHDVRWLLRRDGETTGVHEEAVRRGLAPVDWLDPRRDGTGALDRVLDRLGRVSRRWGPAGALTTPALGAALDRRAAAEVSRGLALLGSGRVVVTDRLHAHLLCYLMGVPHVVLQDRHGKVGRASRLWVGEHAWVRHAPDLATAVEEAGSLLRSGTA